MTYEEIKDETSISDRELTRALQPLAIGKASQRILIKNPKTKEIELSHTFQVNDAFTSQLYRIKVQQASARLGETEPERNETKQVMIFIYRTSQYQTPPKIPHLSHA
jgi:cullin 3